MSKYFGVVCWDEVDSCEEVVDVSVDGEVLDVAKPQEHPMDILLAVEVRVYPVEAAAAVEAQPTLREEDALDVAVLDGDREVLQQVVVRERMVVHTHDNSNNNSPSTLLDHSIHVVPVVAGDDMQLEEVAVVPVVVEEL